MSLQENLIREINEIKRQYPGAEKLMKEIDDANSFPKHGYDVDEEVELYKYRAIADFAKIARLQK